MIGRGKFVSMRVELVGFEDLVLGLDKKVFGLVVPGNETHIILGRCSNAMIHATVCCL